MNNPFLIMTFLYIAMGVLAALDAALVNLSLVPAFSGLRWLRVHIYHARRADRIRLRYSPDRGRAAPPVAASARPMGYLARAQPRAGDPDCRHPAGQRCHDYCRRYAGFYSRTDADGATWSLPCFARRTPIEGRSFYLAALLFLLVGIIVGTGLWQNWLPWLQIKTPLEVHIHANNWGFMSLLFAGLIVDSYPRITGRDLAWPDVR